HRPPPADRPPPATCPRQGGALEDCGEDNVTDDFLAPAELTPPAQSNEHNRAPVTGAALAELPEPQREVF
ncbi:MAG: hypothetical protein IPO00_08320, partial [Betaproteobacteria bacterium]|nr:hypothetical protein [Betaproteobacteria bacterium]